MDCHGRPGIPDRGSWRQRAGESTGGLRPLLQTDGSPEGSPKRLWQSGSGKKKLKSKVKAASIPLAVTSWPLLRTSWSSTILARWQ